MRDHSGPLDYFDEAYVKQWASAANAKRPFRSEFFDAFVSELSALHKPRVLDVGCGPGFLAERILTACDVASYHLFDFSPHMIEMSRARLRDFVERAVFHQGSFLDEGWTESLPAPFDAIVSLQTIHFAHDSARVQKLYGELKSILREGGVLLIADRIGDGVDKEGVLSPSEHEAALSKAGFEEIRLVHAAGDLVMFAAVRRG